ncbi:MAG: DUF2490 domain-containing protein [Chitinophagales bacterium]
MRVLFLLLIPFIAGQLFAQNHSAFSGLFPEAQVSYTTQNKLKFTGKIESQHVLLSKEEATDANLKYMHDRTDFQFFIGTRINPFISIAGGYQYRWEGGASNSHRSIQQISFLQKKAGFRMAHRLRTDQKFTPAEPGEYRIRYRIGFEIPMQGKSLDPGEFYMVSSDEAIFSYEGGDFGIENRLAFSVGKFFNRKHKAEFGIDYRTDDFLDGGSRHRIWAKAGWYVSLSKTK